MCNSFGYLTIIQILTIHRNYGIQFLETEIKLSEEAENCNLKKVESREVMHIAETRSLTTEKRTAATISVFIRISIVVDGERELLQLFAKTVDVSILKSIFVGKVSEIEYFSKRLIQNIREISYEVL